MPALLTARARSHRLLLPLLTAAAVVTAGLLGGWAAATTFAGTSLPLLWPFVAAVGGLAAVSAVAAWRGRVLRRRLEAAANEYRLAADDDPAFILRFRADGRVLFGNRAVCEFVGKTAGELAGTTLAESGGGLLVRPADGQERQAVGAAGVPTWVRWTCRAVAADDDGEGARFQAVGVDLTAERRREDERRREEERAFHQQKLESLGVVAGGVAHDFNNLLTAVLGYADLAAADVPPGSGAVAHLDRVTAAARRAADLNQHLLAYSGRGAVQLRPVGVNAVVRQAVEACRAAKPAAVTVGKRLAEDLPVVAADEVHLRQAVAALLQNAVDAVGESGHVSVRTERVAIDRPDVLDTGTKLAAPPGEYVQVSVADSGCGMPPAVAARMFEPFFTTKFTGRGLGLAAVQGIVRAHKGVVRVDTAPGRGTAVTLLLPVCPTCPPPSAATVPVPAAATDRRRAVLVCDDEETVRELTAELLRQNGWEPLVADGGPAALALFRRNADRVRFAVLDWMMPDMTGRQVLDALRGLRPDLPVLVCTGFAEAELPAFGDDGGTALLTKPFRPPELHKAVRGLLAKSPAGASTTADTPAPALV